ncbi:cyclin-like protein [Mucor mucedo]|uniref:cyclin-like protein n=1 Tax=Mucor mucedo TaxID=29922 RepID=UPI002220C326|nr:cyclin-like protein [Mucor mucedo]KAI7893221.1 cyclin-like protein [Mucor mucedo]
MNTQAENIRRTLDVSKGENAVMRNESSFLKEERLGGSQTQYVKSFAAVNAKKGLGLSQQGLSQQGYEARKGLSDNSNKVMNKASKAPEKVAEKEEAAPVPIEDTQESLKEEFFKDNQTRYKNDEPELEGFRDIVPILPIKVPQHLRHLYIKKPVFNTKSTSGTTSGSKRPNEEPQPEAEKKLRSTEPTMFRPDAPALNLKLNEETLDLNKEQETRAKLAMLQTTQTLKEHQWNDPMLVAEYAGEIFGYLYDAEPKCMADPSYAMISQHEVTWKMRSVLVDWVIEIHCLFNLLPETLFLAVNIIDRFLSQRTVVLGKLQLVGITSLFIAAKFEEMISPTMFDFLHMTDNAVKDDELIKAERFILQVLDFRLCYPNPVNFLRRVCTDELKCDVHTRTLANYFMEISCVDHKFIGIRPSKIAAASLWLSKKMLAKGKWNSNFSKLAGYTPEDLKPTVEAMLDFLSQPLTHDAFFKKWSSSRLSKASIFVRDWVNRYYINE